eukprot:UN25566
MWPLNGGSYTYLRKLYGEDDWGQLAGYMFIWQFFVSGPAELASGYIAIAEYLLYFGDTGDYWTRVSISLGLCICTSLLLFRNISEVGGMTIFLWAVTLFAMAFTMIAGFAHYDNDNLKSPNDAFDGSSTIIWAIAVSTRFGIYDMTGYYDVCSFGGDCQNPKTTVPKSCIYTCFIVGIIYILVYLAVLGAIPYTDYIDAYSDDDASPYGIMSVFTEQLFNKELAYFITIIVCITIFGSNFAQLCGYAYLPFAASQDGLFFQCFQYRTDTGLPYYSLMTVCVLSSFWCFFRWK